MPWMRPWALVGTCAQAAVRASSARGGVNRAQFREQEEGLSPLLSESPPEGTVPILGLHTQKSSTHWRDFRGGHQDSGGWTWASPVTR